MNKQTIVKLAKKNGTIGKLYEQEVNDRIRARYTLSNELAILRQRDEKPDEYAEYNAYVEQCKNEVKAELAL